MMRRFGKYFLTGLVVLLPAIITITVLQLFFGWIFRLFIRPVARLAEMLLPADLQSLFLVQLVIIAGFILTVAFLGFATRVLVLRRFMDMGEAFVRRVPIIGKIYGTSREISKSFSGGRRGGFGRVVLLQWPRLGMYAIGFVTSEGKGEVQEKTPEHVVNVFVPSTPNPTSGYLVLAPRESLIEMEMSVEDGMRLVISGGMTGPDVRLPHPRG